MCGQAARRGLARVEAGHEHLAGGGLEQAVQELGEGRLAGAVLADDAHDLAGARVEGEVLHGGAAPGVGKADVAEADHGVGGSGRAGLCGGAGLRVLLACCGAPADEVRDEVTRLGDAQAGRPGPDDAVLVQAVGDARHAGAVHAERPQLAPVREDRARRAVKGDPAPIHHDDAVAVLAEQGDLLLDDHDGDAGVPIERAQRLEDRARRDGVERRGGLVEDEDARAQRQHGGDGDLLLLAAGERRDLALAQVGDAHGLKRVGEAAGDLVVGHAEVLEAEEQLVLHHGGDHLGVDVLVDAAHDAGDVGERDLAGVAPVHERRPEELPAVVVGDGAGHDGGERGLAGARGADHAHELPRRDAEGDVVERGSRGRAVRKRDVVEPDDGGGAGHGDLS